MTGLEIISIVRGSMELVQLYQAMAIEAGKRQGLSAEERLRVFQDTETEIEKRDPDLIPDPD